MWELPILTLSLEWMEFNSVPLNLLLMIAQKVGIFSYV